MTSVGSESAKNDAFTIMKKNSWLEYVLRWLVSRCLEVWSRSSQGG